MEMARCPYCQGEIQPEAIKCKHCKTDLVKISYTPEDKHKDSIVLSLISFLLIAYTILASLYIDNMDKSDMASLALLAQISLIIGVVSVCKRRGLRGLAKISILLSGITSFVLLGLLGEF